MSDYEHLVPLDEFGLGRMSAADIDAYAAVAGVTVRRDYLDRPAVSLADAYSIAEQRRQAEQEWRESESRRHVEHAAAVADLEKRFTAAFLTARDEEMRRLRADGALSPAAARSQAVNAGLVAARMVWAAAPADVREGVRTVDVVEGDTVDSYDLGVAMPRAVVDEYLRRSARDN